MNEFIIDGRPVPFVEGQTVAAALVAAGRVAWRTTRVRHRPRGVFCGIGVCFDCLVTIDGAGGRRACLVPARQGMNVTTGETVTTGVTAGTTTTVTTVTTEEGDDE
ncbi:(2Fe-2S)-binding protein [Streptomyces anandii]|uniref:(2Fe-2S)-binding protein n=1 Tax=Streptomyces anandii TaxID=285454 RepID=A0ABW6HDV7_9ACTN